MKKFPIIFIIDDNINENRLRMLKRNTDGDFKRCMIENYVKTQNLVYKLFGLLCEFPIFNAFDNNEEIVNLLVNKVIQNNNNTTTKIDVDFVCGKLNAAIPETLKYAEDISILK